MPRTSRWLVRAGLVWLVVALVVPALAPIGAGLPYATTLHMLTVGWLTQLILGVGYWMFPPASRERPRGPDGLMPAAFVLLNTGLLLRVATEPLAPAPPGAAVAVLVPAVLAASGFLQALAAVLAAAALWPRVRSVGS